MISLNNIESVVLKVNDECFFSDNLHESVGFTNEFLIEDETIVKCIDSKVKYHHPERLKQNMSGADEATETFIFKTLKTGETKIIFKHFFRGKLEEEKQVKIIVQ